MSIRLVRKRKQIDVVER